MKREEHWKALTDAGDAFDDAFNEWKLRGSPQTITGVEDAIHNYVQRLAAVVGSVAAFEYEARSRAFFEAVWRQVRLTATLSASPSTDDADIELLQRLAEEQAAAWNEFEAATVALGRDFRFACPRWPLYTPEGRRAHEILFVAQSASSRGRHLSPR